MCEHKYQVLDSGTTSFYSDANRYGIDVSVAFYCGNVLILNTERSGLIEVRLR